MYLNFRDKESIPLLILGIVSALFFICNVPVDAPGLYLTNYVVLLVSFIFCISLLFLCINKRKFSLFDPFLFVSLLCFCIFLIQPMMDILNNEILMFGRDPSPGCKYGTVIFIFSYIAFAVGFFLKKNKKLDNKIYKKIDIHSGRTSSIPRLSFILWFISFCICLFYLRVNGYSFQYILTFGNRGATSIDEIFSKFGFLWKFSGCLITSMLYYFVFGRNKVIKLLIYVLSATVFIINGGRAILLVFLSAPLIYYYVKTKRGPSLLSILIVFFFLLLIFAWLQSARWGIRTGGVVTVEKSLSIKNLIEPVVENFRIYKDYYFFIMSIPERIDYLLGEEIFLYTIFMLIPRAIWRTKPDAPFREVLREAVGQDAVDHGDAFPYLAEFYIDFGLVGCVIFSFIYGWIVSKLNFLRMFSEDKSHGIILFSVFLPFLFQFTMRGYIPSNFYTIIITLIPYFIIRLVAKSSS